MSSSSRSGSELASPALPHNGTRAGESMGMTKPTAQQVMEMIVSAARRQVATSAEGKAISDAGLAKALDEILVSAAANVAQPICWSFEDDASDAA